MPPARRLHPPDPSPGPAPPARPARSGATARQAAHPPGPRPEAVPQPQTARRRPPVRRSSVRRPSVRPAPRRAGPAPREVESWFGPDETGEHPDDDHDTPGDPVRDRDAEPTGLLPLRPAGPVKTAQATPPRKLSRKERQNPGPATVHTRTAPARRGVSRIAAFLVLAVLALIIAGGVFLFQPLKGDGEGDIRVRSRPDRPSTTSAGC